MISLLICWFTKSFYTGQNRCYRVHIGYISGTWYVPDMCEICVCYLIILHISGTRYVPVGCRKSVTYNVHIGYISHTYWVVKYRLHIIDLLGTRYILKKYRTDIIHLSDSANKYPIYTRYVSYLYLKYKHNFIIFTHIG